MDTSGTTAARRESWGRSPCLARMPSPLTMCPATCLRGSPPRRRSHGTVGQSAGAALGGCSFSFVARTASPRRSPWQQGLRDLGYEADATFG